MDEKYQIGDKVKIINTGKCYPFCGQLIVRKFVERYHPSNAIIESNFNAVYIEEGHETSQDLALRKDLQWKVRWVFPNHNLIKWQPIYLVASNQNHILYIEEDGIE